MPEDLSQACYSSLAGLVVHPGLLGSDLRVELLIAAQLHELIEGVGQTAVVKLGIAFVGLDPLAPLLGRRAEERAMGCADAEGDASHSSVSLALSGWERE